MTSHLELIDRMARAVAAAMLHSQEQREPGPVMADRRTAAQAAAASALACIKDGDDLGNGLKAVASPEPRPASSDAALPKKA